MNSASTDSERGRLLLVGDPGPAAAAGALLRAAGHYVQAVEPGSAAAAAGGSHDVVVAIAPPAVCSHLIGELRDQPERGGIYVIAGCPDGAQAAFSALAGLADDLLVGPLDPAELAFRVRRGLAVVRTRERVAVVELALRERAMSDSLTGLPNRRAIEQMVTAEAARVSRAGAVSCVVCVDLDDFHTVNERHGAAVGDLMLVAFSGAIQRNLRAQDGFGRVDGDEFVILLRDTTTDEAVDACGRLSEAVSVVRVPVGRGDLALSASFGIAPIRPADQPGQALDVADCALYAAHAAGRGRIETATESLA